MKQPLDRLQSWYVDQCDGNWEHQYGVKIDTLDNPGWTVKIDLHVTVLYGKPFAEISHNNAEDDWMHCSIIERTFVGNGGSLNLSEILTTFLDWAEQT